MRNLLLVALCALIFGQLAGCRDQGKLDACKTDAKALENGEGCKACCNAAGSQYHSYMNFDKASCECK